MKNTSSKSSFFPKFTKIKQINLISSKQIKPKRKTKLFLCKSNSNKLKYWLNSIKVSLMKRRKNQYWMIKQSKSSKLNMMSWRVRWKSRPIAPRNMLERPYNMSREHLKCKQPSNKLILNYNWLNPNCNPQNPNSTTSQNNCNKQETSCLNQLFNLMIHY